MRWLLYILVELHLQQTDFLHFPAIPIVDCIPSLGVEFETSDSRMKQAIAMQLHTAAFTHSCSAIGQMTTKNSHKRRS